MKDLTESVVQKAIEDLLQSSKLPSILDRLERDVRWQACWSLRQKYANLVRHEGFLQELHQFEAKVYSQQGEDGILLHLFSVIGMSDSRFVEFGIQSGRQCNCANLALNFGWRGLFMDCDLRNALRASHFYRARLGARASEVVVHPAMITAENINDLLEQKGMIGSLDLLSIDIDGNDFWVWKAINVVQPRVVVIEYNSVFGPEQSVTIPYDPAFKWCKSGEKEPYFGASIAALAKLGEEKGYHLVGCDSWGVNAFFVRRDAADGRFLNRSPREVYMPQLTRVMHGSLEEDAQRVSRLPLEQV